MHQLAGEYSCKAQHVQCDCVGELYVKHRILLPELRPASCNDQCLWQPTVGSLLLYSNAHPGCMPCRLFITHAWWYLHVQAFCESMDHWRKRRGIFRSIWWVLSCANISYLAMSHRASKYTAHYTRHLFDCSITYCMSPMHQFSYKQDHDVILSLFLHTQGRHSRGVGQQAS